MGWIILLAMALAVGVALWRFAALPKGALELVAAALLLGVAGYAWQGSPGLPGKPTPPKAEAKQPDSEFSKSREGMMSMMGSDAQVLDTADAFHRQGLDAYAIAVLRGGLEKRPRSADLWVGLGNALVIYGGGLMSPAARLAFDRAAALAPDHPGPPFFLGLAFAQAGQLDRAEATWQALLDRAPAGAPWRADVEQRLVQLRAQQQMGQ
ncbi:tetratricopeptide repeat protein [Sphingomonas profundi]|uniref:tetratricopeptide repeat protein n=1 Tax=Alterirhizorhabdus profundi TaxID=2681549 RepID=UPI0018D0836B|nr:cytochrome C biogenesis protein [Sphingomonas profundi]